MTHQQILGKAIEKAIADGWKGTRFYTLGGDWMGDTPRFEVFASPFGLNDAWFVYHHGGVGGEKTEVQPEHIIFNHDFARALWGSRFPKDNLAHTPLPYWKWQLQQMVIADDPIQYLGEHLDA